MSKSSVFDSLTKCILYLLLILDCVSFTEKKVKNFILHPKYNINGKVKEGVLEFYDYDVALIQLEEYVQISSSVR